MTVTEATAEPDGTDGPQTYLGPPPEEVHTPEVVAPSTDLEPAGDPAVTSALERAADAALAMPGIPGRDEFLSMAMQARILSMSAVAPKALRGNPHVAFHVVMIGRDLGISPSAAIELVDVIGEGQDARPSMSPQLLLGQIRRLGLGRIAKQAVDDWSAVAVALGPDGEFLGDSEFTWEDAQTAGLVDQRCDPRNHWKPDNGQGRCKCRQGWRTYPRRMLWWRAAGYAASDYFPEAGLGLYAPEELGALVDDAGRPIDPATVELPEGYDNTPPPPAPVAPADPAALWDLQVRIRALPDDQRSLLAARWRDSGRLTYDPTEEGAPRQPIPVRALPARALSNAESMVTGFERLAVKAGWDLDEARANVERTVAVAVAPMVVPMAAVWPVADPDAAAPTEPAGGAEGAQEALIPPDLTYAPEALAEAEAIVADMTTTEVEDTLTGWTPPARLTGLDARDRAHLAVLFAARASG